MLKKVVSILCVIVWMGVIFGFSNETGTSSGGLTEEIIVNVVEIVSDIKKDTKEMDKMINKLSFPLRKMAHFFVYFVLAFLIMNALITFGIRKKTIIITSLICVFYAISDEVHQLFISGRSGQVSDVLLDSSAAILSSFIFHRLIVIRWFYEKGNN